MSRKDFPHYTNQDQGGIPELHLGSPMDISPIPSKETTRSSTTQKSPRIGLALPWRIWFACIGIWCVASGFRCGALIKDCLDDSDCPSRTTCRSYACVARSTSDCRNDLDCNDGQFCNDGQCAPKPISCTKDADCPTTQTCQQSFCAPCKAIPEECNGKDDDCDGLIDENITRSCYNGPRNTKNVGECKDGIQACQNGQWGACSDVPPQIEKCGDNKDNDCDGQVDEGCLAGAIGLYEWCNSTELLCHPSLICHANLCLPRCDRSKGDTNNPDCPDPEKELCESTFRNEGVCKRICQAGGIYDNPSCPTHTYCAVKGTGLCYPNTPPRYGTQTLGQNCSISSGGPSPFCDGRQNFVCIGEKCRYACDPHKANEDCPTGFTCIGTNESHLGGYCGQ